MIVIIVGLGAVLGLQLNWLDVGAEHRRPSWGFADTLSIVRELDIGEGTGAPYLLEEGCVGRLGNPERDASGIGEAHLLGINRGALRLLGVRALQLVTS